MLSNSKKGFTLIELLLVISIIGILSSVLLGSLNAAREKAQIVKAKSEINTLYQVLLRYYLDNQSWPPGCNNIDLLAEWNGAWSDPYISGVYADPWGKSYFFDGCPDIECGVGASAICSGGPNGLINGGSFNRADTTPLEDDICIYFIPSC